jgi:OOP family OmpA-OmpF porin
MSRSAKAVVVLFLATISAPTFADGLYAYVGVGTSHAKTNRSDFDSILARAGATALVSSLDNTDVGWKAQLGYMLDRNFGIEGGWVDLGAATYTATYGGGTGSATAKASGINLAGIGVIPLNARFSLFGKLGAIEARVRDSASFSGPGASATASVNSMKLRANIGGGVIVDLSPEFAIRAEYERFKLLGDTHTTGTGDIELISVGFKYSF